MTATKQHQLFRSLLQRAAAFVVCLLMLLQGPIASAAMQSPNTSSTGSNNIDLDIEILEKTDKTAAGGNDTVLTVVSDEKTPYGLDGKRIFNPDPTRAVWLSALLPGLGQIYNRRYWKLPIIVGGYMGLAYATSWNNTQLQDYTQAYLDITDSDPSTNSYMNFFPPTTNETDLDKSWLGNTLKSRRDYYRRNRDLCIIGMVALYLLCILDSYVDATLAHFDISDNLSLDLSPALMPDHGPRRAGVGLQWAFTF